MEYKTKTTIKTWAEEDRPREKMMLKGKHSLSEAELLAIIISSGSLEYSAVELSKIILSESKNNLNELAQLSIKDLQKFKGIGEAKAISIVAALELGRRRKESKHLEKPIFSNSSTVYEYLKQYMLDLKHEEFWLLLLNRKLELIKSIKLSSGGLAGTVVDLKIIYKYALENLCTSIILSHNHPSGNLKPSASDLRITKEIVDAGKFFNITVSDHIIFTNAGFYSMADNQEL